MFLGMFAAFLGCSASQVHKEHNKNKFADMKKKEIEARGGGMWIVKDGKLIQVKD